MLEHFDLYYRIKICINKVDHLLLCKQQPKTVSVEYFSINTFQKNFHKRKTNFVVYVYNEPNAIIFIIFS